MKYKEILEACWKGYQQKGMKKKGNRQVPNCVPVEEATGDPFIDDAARELLAMVLMFGVPFAVGVYIDIRNKLRKYQGKQIIDALEKKGVTMNRETYEKVKPVLDRFDQAVRDNEGAEAKALAKRIEQMIIMGKLSAVEPTISNTSLSAKERELQEDLKKWFKEKWVRFGPDGKIRGDCARGSESEGKPKCLPQSKAHALGKKGRASAAAKKRREDPNPERRGPARNVATKVKEQGVAESSVDNNAKLSWVAKKLASETVIPGDRKDFLKAAKRFDRGYTTGGMDIIYDMDTDPRDDFFNYCDHYGAVYEQGVAEMDKSQTPPARHGDYPLGAKGTTVKPVPAKKVVKDLARDLDKAFAKEKKVKEDANPKFAGLIKNIQARMKKDDYQRPEIIKRVAQMVQQADPTVPDAMATARELVQQHGQGPVVKQTNVWDLKAQARSGNLAAQLPKTSAGTPSYAQQHATFEEQSTNNDDWYDDADEFGMPGSEFFSDDDRLRDGDYVRDRQDGEYGEIFRMSGDPTERRVRILDRDGKGWYISPERLVAVDRNDPDIMKYFGKRRHRDMDEGRNIVPAETTVANAKKLWQYTQRNLVDLASNSEFDRKHNELFVDEKLNGLLKTASGQPVQVAFDQGGNIEFNNGILYIPIEAMYYYRGYMTSQKFVQDVVQALDQTQIAEKQDACYRKVKSRYKVWPSAYASGALVQCRKRGAANWGNKGKK